MNALLIFELVFSIIAIFFMINRVDYLYPNVNYFIFDDLYASLNAIEYTDSPLDYICNVTETILPENFAYEILLNNSFYCGSLIENPTYELEYFVVFNSTLYNVTILIKK